MLTRDKVVGIIRIRKVVLSVPVWTIVSACINRFAIKKSHLLVKPVPGYAICGQTKQRACDVWQCQVSVLLSALFPRATVGIVVRTQGRDGLELYPHFFTGIFTRHFC